MIRNSLATVRTWLTAALVMGSCTLGFGQSTVVLDDGTEVPVITKYDTSVGAGPAQPASQSQNPSGGLSYYSANYLSLGSKFLPFNIVGTDPSLGTATTSVGTFIVPLKIVYDTQGGFSLDGTNQEGPTVASPIFQTADFVSGGVDIGTTQYGDAIQRSEWWGVSGFDQGGYHVLLGQPALMATQTLHVTCASGPGTAGCQGVAYQLSGGTLIGVVRSTVLDKFINGLVSQFRTVGLLDANGNLQVLNASQLPIFLTDSVYEGSNGTINTCCILGYHNSQGPPAATAQTWIYAGWTRNNTFRNNVILDVQALSHEVSEWLNDPFVGSFRVGFLNIVAPYVLPGQGGACQVNFETGDVLEAPPIVFTEMTSGTTYHLQDEAYIWYFLQGPSFAANGEYSYLGTFASPSTLCGPG